MIQLHWDIQNRFEHYGSGDFGMLGWDALRDSASLSLFQFKDFDKERMQDQLLDSLPGKLYSLVSEQPVTVDAMRHIFANQTAARFSDLDEIILQLVREKEFSNSGSRRQGAFAFAKAFEGYGSNCTASNFITSGILPQVMKNFLLGSYPNRISRRKSLPSLSVQPKSRSNPRKFTSYTAL